MKYRRALQFLFLWPTLLGCIVTATATMDKEEEELAYYTSVLKGVKNVRWQPNGDWILFVRDGDKIVDKNGKKTAQRYQYIYKIRADGTGLTRLTSYGDDACPMWSRDGKSIAFISSRNGGDFFKMDADGKNVTSLGKHPGYLNLFSWSPDGKSLGFITRRGSGGPYVAVMAASGKNAGGEDYFLTKAFNADWHPSERYMVIEAEGEVINKPQEASTERYNYLYEINISTRQRRQITSNRHNDRSPRYSPNGEWIAFLSNRERSTAGSSICLMRRNGTGLFGLPLHDPDRSWGYSQPDFSPDGQRLVFARGKYVLTDLYICRRDGTELRRLTNFYPVLPPMPQKTH